MPSRPSSALAFTVAALGVARPAIAAPELADPVGVTVSWSDAIDRALARNPSVEAAAADVRRAEAIVTETRAGWLPSLVANGAYTRLDADRRLASGAIAAAQSQWSASLTLAVPLLAPARWLSDAHARDDVESTRAAADDVRRTLASTTARTYISAVTQKRLIEIAERARATAGAHEAFARQRFEGRVGNRLDLVRASQEVATASAQLANARAQLVALEAALGVLIGVDGPVDPTDPPALDPAPPTAANLDDVVRSRADVQVATRRFEAADRVTHDDWALHAPSLVGAFTPFYQDPATLTVPHTGWQVQLLLSLPLFEGELRVGQAREHRSLADRRHAELASVVNQARAEAQATWATLAHARAALDEARRAAQLATEALDLATLAYRAGASTNLEVVDAERRARDAESAAAVAEDAQHRALLDFWIAAGRFPSPGRSR